MMLQLPSGGSVAAVSTAAGISVALEIPAAVASRSRCLAFPPFHGTDSEEDDSQDDKADQNDRQSTQSAWFGFHLDLSPRVPLHLKVINND
ncbi:hypothetical protein OIU34_30720 [Pararhizobium sp. BT-229]|uniref:hypothetical protein n=1 Tax=Pararhizobium sp. BT-229 TaxID=2986923 RepID=UPI0021F7392C|nr:hypothetical protein [Pararhizobium sp. BT-229]MCV9966251.1 hypothetical protein [Pararhizobium sp. BT-229]